MLHSGEMPRSCNMPVDFMLDSIDGVDGELKVKDLYKEVDGKYQFDISGVVPESKYKKISSDLDSMRGTLGEKSSQLESFSGLDVNKYREMETEIAKLRDSAGSPVEFDFKNMTDEQRKLASNSTVDLYEKRLQAAIENENTLKSGYEKQVADLTNSLHGGAIERAMRAAMHERKTPASAVDDGLRLARDELVYRTDVEAKNEIDRLYTKDGVPFNTFIESEYSKRPHWLPGSVSGNPTGGGSTGTPNAKAEAYMKAEKSGNIEEMIRNAPTKME